MPKQYIRYICIYNSQDLLKNMFLRMSKRDPFVRFISIHDVSTPIRTDYEALVGFVGF